MHGTYTHWSEPIQTGATVLLTSTGYSTATTTGGGERVIYHDKILKLVLHTLLPATV